LDRAVFFDELPRESRYQTRIASTQPTETNKGYEEIRKSNTAIGNEGSFKRRLVKLTDKAPSTENSRNARDYFKNELSILEE